MRKRTTVIAAVAVLAVGGGVAYAAWSSTGKGDGSVASAEDVESKIVPVDGAGGLYPGATVEFIVEIDNPNPYAVQVTAISAGSSEETAGGCAEGTVTSAAGVGGRIEVGQKARYALKATMNVAAADNCKDQTFTLPLTASLLSAA
jgi:predicted ribosomally synthesized peptide with SipW-like signal peptide